MPIAARRRVQLSRCVTIGCALVFALQNKKTCGESPAHTQARMFKAVPGNFWRRGDESARQMRRKAQELGASLLGFAGNLVNLR
jgi:hypothetical protein